MLANMTHIRSKWAMHIEKILRRGVALSLSHPTSTHVVTQIVG
jgi:hypothetical protein